LRLSEPLQVVLLFGFQFLGGQWRPWGLLTFQRRLVHFF
jgi:hypothetical protein